MREETTHTIPTIVRLAIAIALASGVTLAPVQALSQCTSTDATAPCFADNDDILGGQRFLLKQDDLVMMAPYPDGSGFLAQNLVLDTVNNAISATKMWRNPNAGCLPNATDDWWVQQHVRAGRVYDLANDVAVTAVASPSATGSICDGTQNMALYVTDPTGQLSIPPTYITTGPGQSQYAGLALGDFDKDGYQEVFYMDGGQIQVFAPTDPTSTTSPLVSMATLPLTSAFSPRASPVTGDFNGDGVLDVAWVGVTSNWIVYLASVCPAANAVVLGQTCSSAYEVILSAQTIDTGIPPVTNYKGPSLAADDFDGSVDTSTGIADDELAVVLPKFNPEEGGPDLIVQAYHFDSDLVPTAGPNALTAWTEVIVPPNFIAATGIIDWDSPQAQLVIAGDGIPAVGESPVPQMVVITFSPSDLAMTLQATTTSENFPPTGGGFLPLVGMAIGRFDPPDTSSGGTDFNQQIAVAFQVNDPSTEQGFPLEVWTYTVELPSFQPQAASSYNTNLLLLTPFATTGTGSAVGAGYDSLLQAGDFQGRSLLVGEPTSKITVTQTQPDIVLGMPPMHVDFIEPLGGGTPEVVNVSVYPNTFNTGYDFSATAGTTASSQMSTSYTVATKESVSGSLSFGVPGVDSVSATLKESIQQSYEKSVAQSYNTYSGESYNFSAATVFDDKVGANASQMNVYTYPVIGQMACPEDSPNCPTDCSPGPSPCPMVPLTVQYSGPDNIIQLTPTDAAGLEWYQPPNEPGNLFSYPGSLELLEATLPQLFDPSNQTTTSSLELLTPSDQIWGSQSTETFSTSWNSGGGADVSSGSVATLVFDTSVSVSANATAEDLGVGGGASASFDYSQSTSLSTLNTGTQTLAASTGVTLHRGVANAVSDSAFLYQGGSYIFGQLAPPGTLQTDLTTGTVVESQGYLQVGHVADMLSTGVIESGAWWRQAYAALPDVALNRPQRWAQMTPLSSQPQQVHYYCPIGFTAAFGTPSSDPGSCTPTSEVPNTANTADAPFYQMKGLFVTPGTGSSGPTTTSATLGDQLTLRARAYNYSLANMPAGTQVHVQFYAQPWDNQLGEFTSGSGPFGFAEAVYIGEDVLGPIPAFCGGSSASSFDPCTDEGAPLNWVIAQVPWDTSTLSPQPTTETFWKFWVVVWMEDGSGNLVSEIAEHGLTNIPGTNLGSLVEVPVETYSNNMGFYNQVFSLELPTAGAAAAPAPGAEPQGIAIRVLDASNTGFVPLDSRKVFRFEHQATGDRLDHVLALLYEGDPDQSGKLLDVDIIPHIPVGGTFVVPFPYVPRTCGVQTLFVRAYARGGVPPATTRHTVRVPCEVRDLRGTVTRLSRDEKGGLLRISGRFSIDRDLDLETLDTAVTVYSLLADVGGSGDAAGGLPLLLAPARRDGPLSAVYESAAGTQGSAELEVRKEPHAGEYSFSLAWKKAPISVPHECPRPELLTSLVIDDGSNIPVLLVAETAWRCLGDQRYEVLHTP